MFNFLNQINMKKSILFWALFLAVLLAGSVTVSSCGSKKDKQEQTDKQVAPAAEDDEEIVYACPMHPEITGGKDDTCSKCGMALEEVEEEGHDHDEDHD
jgi:hypothetical protein